MVIRYILIALFLLTGCIEETQMHRVESDDTVTESGVNRYADFGPTENGTIVAAEALNAIQEEIINIIEDAGLTVEVSAATDRSNGWAQLSEAIFSSAAIDTAALTDAAVTNAKVSDVAIDKLTYLGDSFEATWDHLPDIDQTIIMSPYYLSIGNLNETGSPSVSMVSTVTDDYLRVRKWEGSSNTIAQLELSVAESSPGLHMTFENQTDSAYPDTTALFTDSAINLTRYFNATAVYENTIGFSSGFLTSYFDGTATEYATLSHSGLSFEKSAIPSSS